MDVLDVLKAVCWCCTTTMASTEISDGTKKVSTKKMVASMFVVMMGEILGLATYMFIGCMGCIHDAYPNVNYQFMPFTFGLGVALAIQLFGHISGAHYNPIVTLAAIIMGKMKLSVAPFYIFAQFIGAFLGYGLIMVLIPESMTHDLCVTVPNHGITDAQALFIEMIISFLLVMAICTAWDHRLHGIVDSLAIKLGLMFSSIFIAAAPFTGGGLNPPRSLVPAIFHNQWESHWVYWVGPTLGGGIIAPLLYKYVFLEGLSKIDEKPTEEKKDYL